MNEKLGYVNRLSGEVLPKEFVLMSRRPGIGSAWIEKFCSDVYPRGIRVIKGLDTPSCKFYDSRYEVSNPDGFAALKRERDARRLLAAKDNTPRRLLDKETVKLSQIKSLSTAKEV